MEAEKIKVHIDAVQRELLEKYHLTQYSFDGLANITAIVFRNTGRRIKLPITIS